MFRQEDYEKEEWVKIQQEEDELPFSSEMPEGGISEERGGRSAAEMPGSERDRGTGQETVLERNRSIGQETVPAQSRGNEQEFVPVRGRDSGQGIVPAQSEDYKSFIVKYNTQVFTSVPSQPDGTFLIVNDIFSILYERSMDIPEVELNSFSYNSIPKCYTYMDVDSLQASGVTRLHEHPYLQLRGNGTLVAVIDSGIDYQNQAFRNGNSSKILEIWDQTIQGGPSEYAPFGRVFTKEEIDRALASENPLEIVPSTDTNGHGTMLAGTAAGKTIEEEGFSGAAPEASLLVIKLKPAKEYLRRFYLYPSDVDLFQEDDIMLAIAYAGRCAQRYGMPLSICLGLGTNKGSHDGYSPLCQTIDYMAGFSRNSISIAAGNEGAARHHYQGRLDQNRTTDTVELRVGERTEQFSMELWGSAPEVFSVTIQTPTGESLPVSTALRGSTQELSFVFVETRVLVNYVPIERYSGNTLIYFRFLHPAAGIWRFQVQGRDVNGSLFHMWLPVTGLIPDDTFFLQSSPYHTVTSPGDADDGMTMTAYQYRDGSLFPLASRGFTPAGEVKPDFAAPGVEIKVPMLGNRFGLASGTSLAAAQTAGIAALLFEWAVIRGNEPFFTGNSVKYYLQRGARRDGSLTHPNPDWGYGKIDLYHTFELLP